MRRTFLPLFVLALVVGTGCPWARVTQEDCKKWADHYESVLNEQGGKKIDKCKKGSAATEAKKQLADNVDTTKETLLTTCQGLAGTLPKSKKDEECFLDAKSPDAWGKCNFATTSPLFVFGGTPDAAKASWAGLCAGGTGGGDDDDKPAKGKKKKAGDDDDDKPAKKKKSDD